jgi:ElaB/YqjD/DUF883 family membrane-anchored ribosome-binding protein
VELGEHFRWVTPDFEPIFLNLPALPPEQLVSAGGYFGRVLRLVQGRTARHGEFRQLLEEAVEALAGMAEAQRLRWLELLSYIHMLVYHERTEPERRDLQEMIELPVQTDRLRQEVQEMKRTIAEAMQEEGRRMGEQQEAVRARQRTLLRLLRIRFGDVPDATVAAIEACRDVEQLDAWLDRLVVAKMLAGVRIRPAP